MNHAVTVVSLIGLVFLFLAAFSLNFPRISSGWFGLALICSAAILPGLGLGSAQFLMVLIILLLLILVVLFLTRGQPPAT